MRKLSQKFASELKVAFLKPILSLVKLDSTLCLEIRENYINIYYRGGNIIRIEENRGVFKASFDRNYLDNNLTNIPVLPDILNNAEDVEVWLNAIPFLKHLQSYLQGRALIGLLLKVRTNLKLHQSIP